MKTMLLSSIVILLVSLSISYGQSIEYENSMLWYDSNDILVDGDVAYCSYAFGILILDICIPSEPVSITRVFIEGLTMSLAKSGDLLFACANGLVIYDVSNPYSPVNLSNFSNGFTYHKVFVHGNFAYSARFSYDEIDYGLDIIDFSNPEEPCLAGTYSTSNGVIDMSFSDSIAYYTTSHGFAILDISNRAHPEYIGDVLIDEHVHDIEIDYPLAYVTYFERWPTERGGINIYDVSEPHNPIFSGGNLFNSWIPAEIIIEFPYAFANTGNGFIILDISDPDDFEVVGSYTCSGRDSYIDNQDDYCYIVAEDSIPVQIVDVSDVNEPELAGTYGFDFGNIYTCKISDDRLYLPSMYGLQIIDITNPSTPIIGDRVDLYAYDYYISDNIAYVSGFIEGVSFYDITNPSEPILVGYFNHELFNIRQVSPMTISDDILYGFSRGDEIFFADISDLSSPLYRGSYDPGVLGLSTMYVADSTLFCSGRYGNLDIVSLEDPENPVEVNTVDTPGNCSQIEVDGNFAYIADGDSGLTILDISDLYDPVVVSQLATEGRFSSFIHNENILIGLNDETDYPPHTQIFIVDISDPYDPSMLVSRELYGMPGDILCKDNYIYVCAYFGLLIYEYDLETGLTEVASIPSSFSLSQNYPNPFNAHTQLNYTLPGSDDVRLDIYDILGRKVQTLYHGNQVAGNHSLIWRADGFASGVYFYILTTGDQRFTRQMTLIK